MRIVANPGRYSALRWYNENLKIKGSPQLLTVDGYPAVRDGRTVYVGGSNVATSSGRLYTNIFIISYNQEAEKATQDIFGQILANWRFNINLESVAGVCSEKTATACFDDEECAGAGFCTSFKAKAVRDTIRMARLTDIATLLETYKTSKDKYPTMAAGSYLPNKSLSTWPSWQETLSKLLGGGGLPIDPINQLADCPGFDKVSCWDQATKNFAWAADLNASRIPLNNYVFLYSAPASGASYDLCTYSETGLIGAPLECNAACVPFCFGRDCGTDGCGGSCGSCLPGESCAGNTCVADCATLPNCQISLNYAIAVSGYCAPGTGSCYQCLPTYNWTGSACSAAGAPCSATPGCRATAPANSTPLAASCGPGLDCYACDPNFSWDGTDCVPDCAAPNFCRSAAPANAAPAAGYCPSGSCFSCNPNYAWNGTSCVFITTCPNGTCDPSETCSSCAADCGACPPACTDADNDGYGTTGSSGCPQSGTDCDDSNAATNPGAIEICDGLDNNCNGVADENCDADNDDFCSCAQIFVYGADLTGVCVNTNSTNAASIAASCDCNDANAAQTTVCGATCPNGVCDPSETCSSCTADCGACPPTCTDTDGDGYGTAGSSGCPRAGTDCDDSNSAINPGAVEVCDDSDNNCSNGVDEGCNNDGDGYCDNTMFFFGYPVAACPSTNLPNGSLGNDCNDTSAAINPGAAEICGNGIDEDCSGADLVCPPTCTDSDNDGYGTAGSSGCPRAGIDCNDSNAAINPGAAEICGNGIDEDCSGADLVCPPPACTFPATLPCNFP